MSLDISITQTVKQFNITHNLTEMASKIPVTDDLPCEELNLYKILWHPDELDIFYLSNIKDYLYYAKTYMENHKDNLQKYNPDNGWGHYDNLYKVVEELHAISVLELSEDYRIEVSR